ncbi:efflux RND transporter periplasmic adaptor subunit [Parasphingorhabdus sp.]|uniref:efflux RND transporter periplasmic adaptor subunit n=1 Tax=Parasphingorhabdus sp. TaxID=2709688 RepID=UPI003BAFF1B5
MAKKKKNSRKLLTIAAVGIVALLLLYAFWPSPAMVDMGEVTQGPMRVTINEEGRTRVHDSFQVSTPTEGRLLRVDVEAGDNVSKGMIVARMTPAPLDSRSRAQARASVTSAQAGLRLAANGVGQARADKRLADQNLARERKLWELKSTSRAALDMAIRDAQSANASVQSAQSTVAMRRGELTAAQSQLIGSSGSGGAIAIRAPATGRILKVMQQSAATLAAGTPVMEIGNITGDLEILVELLSTDAVNVSVGDQVLIDNWGGPKPLRGEVAIIEPQGFTKFSALGVEEQRVNAIVRFTGTQIAEANLGSGFRVETRIIVWQDKDAVIVPSSALFRDQGKWAVFVVSGGDAQLRRVKIGRNNGTQAQVLDGLKKGDKVILYPSSDIVDGTDVEQREVG